MRAEEGLGYMQESYRERTGLISLEERRAGV